MREERQPLCLWSGFCCLSALLSTCFSTLISCIPCLNDFLLKAKNPLLGTAPLASKQFLSVERIRSTSLSSVPQVEDPAPSLGSCGFQSSLAFPQGPPRHTTNYFLCRLATWVLSVLLRLEQSKLPCARLSPGVLPDPVGPRITRKTLSGAFSPFGALSLTPPPPKTL